MSDQVPTIEIGDSTSHGGGASPVNAPFSIGQDLAQLIAKGSVAVQASGARIIKLDAGILAAASPYQIGVIAQGVTCTAAIVAANQALLNELGKYARENGYSIRIEARLALTPAGNWNYLWLGPAVAAGLPVDAVENDDEIAWTYSGTKSEYGEAAQNMVLSMQQISKYYPKVQLGQWEAQSAIANTAAWLTAYNEAANSAGMPRMSYFVADGAQSPWVVPTSTWAAWMTDLSYLASQNGMGLTAFVGGTDVSGSNEQWTAGAEQYAAQLAQLSEVKVDTLLIRTWGNAFPDAILPINKPTTLANAATEIAAIYSLYKAGVINAEGPVTVSAVPQVIATIAKATAVAPISLNWTSSASSNERIAVVVLDNIGKFTAMATGSGTVVGAGSNELILNGTLADVAAELETLKVTQPVPGLDSIDIEVFGENGRLADYQIAVLSVPDAVKAQGSLFKFLPTSSGQDWVSASASVNGGSLVTSMHFDWNTTDVDPTTGKYRIIRSASIHEPLAQSGLVVVNGRLEQSATNQTADGPGSLALDSGFACDAFYSPGHFSTVNILATDMYFDPVNGQLRTVVDQLAATDPTALVLGPKLPNYFSTGGQQITQFNTGNNPNWQSNWSASLASVTTVYGSAGNVLEMIYLGNPQRPGFVLDNVFNPYTGALWEQFETLPPPSPYASYSAGTQLIIEYNTGDNPNWNYGSWGDNPHVMITWQDYYPVTVSTTYPSSVTGADNNDTLSLYGTADVAQAGDFYAVNMNGLDGTAAVGSDSTAWLWGSNNTLTAGDRFKTWIPGGENVLRAGEQAEISLGTTSVNNVATAKLGSQAWDYGTGNSISVESNSFVCQFGSNGTVVGGDRFHGWGAGSGNKMTAGSHSTVAIVGNYNTAVVGDGSTINLEGNHNLAVIGDGDMVFIAGNSETVAIASNNGAQYISGFEIRHDRLNLVDLLGQGKLRHDLSNLSDFVGVTHTRADTILTIRGADVMDTVTLRGVGSLDLAQFVSRSAVIVSSIPQ